jgi:hypothetical protein
MTEYENTGQDDSGVRTIEYQYRETVIRGGSVDIPATARAVDKERIGDAIDGDVRVRVSWLEAVAEEEL